MSTAQLRELVEAGGLVGLTVEQYHQMIDAGILPEGEPIELLDGFMVRKDRAKAGEDPMTVGIEHVWAVQNLPRALAKVEEFGFHVRLQQPVTLPPDGEPEPDGAIAHGTIDDYLRRRPGAGDVPCAIEVADSSLHRDRGTKKRIYAEGGVGQYVIINLLEYVVEVYEQPITAEGRYATNTVLQGGDVVAFSCGGGKVVRVEVSRLLPPRSSST